MNEQKIFKINGVKVKKEWSKDDFEMARAAAVEIFPQLIFTAGTAPKTAAEMFERMPYTSSGDFAGIWAADFEAVQRKATIRAIAMDENGAPVVVRCLQWFNEEIITADTIKGNSVNKILISRKLKRYNERKREVDKVVAAFREVFAKYDGKAAGPKTKHKISDELQAACGWYVYFVENFKLSFRNATNYNNDFEVWTAGENIVRDDNKFNCKVTLQVEGMGAEIVNGTEKRAELIIKAYNKMQEAATAYKLAQEAFNAIKVMFPTVYKMDDVNDYDWNFRK